MSFTTIASVQTEVDFFQSQRDRLCENFNPRWIHRLLSIDDNLKSAKDGLLVLERQRDERATGVCSCRFDVPYADCIIYPAE